MPIGTTIIIIGILLGVAGGAVLLWHQIVHVFSEHVIPFLRRKIGDTVADTVASVIGWLDNKVVLARNAVKSGWRVFKERVLGLEATYRKTSPTTATVETVATLRSGAASAGRVKVTEEEVSLDNLPDEIRQAIINNPTASVTHDVRKDIERKAVKRAEEENIPILDLGLNN